MLRQTQERMSSRAASALVLVMVALAGCDGSGSTAQDPTQKTNSVPTAVATAKAANTSVSPQIVTADNAFGLSILQALQAQAGPVNQFISPLSLSMALQIAYAGASGTTQDAMAQTLQLGSYTTQQVNDANAALQASLIDADPQVQLTIANSLWIHQSQNAVLPAFIQMDQDYYGATIGDLAGAPADVNAWAAQQTNGLITSILPPGNYSRMTALIANAIYFKGQWTSRFDPNATVSAPFVLSDGTTVSVNMMAQTATVAYLHGTDFQMVRLPYGNGRMSMLIVLPDAGEALTDFLPRLTLDALNASIGQMQKEYGAVALPKFTVTYSNEMVPTLKALGMAVALECPGANFSALTTVPVCIDSVLHAARIEVDETGTVAAAVTTVGTIITAVQAPQFNLTLDHPFLYAIRDDETGELLFIGTLLDPTK